MFQDPVWWLGEAWERYNEFEEYRYYDKALSLAQFIAEWETRLVAAVAAGCEYNDTVLAFKLLDRVQLAEEENRALLSLVAGAAARSDHHNEDMLALVKAQLAAQDKVQQEQEEEKDEELKNEVREEGEIATMVKHENGGVVSVGVVVAHTSDPLPLPLTRAAAPTTVIKNERDLAAATAEDGWTLNKGGGGGRVYACNLCPKSFRRPDYLHDHRRSAHGIAAAAAVDESASNSISNSKPFQCTECKKTFSSEANLERHTEGHHAAPGRAFRCPAASCERSYPERSSLMRHIRTHLRAGRGGRKGAGGRRMFRGGSSGGESEEEEEDEMGVRRRGRPKRGDGPPNTGPPFRVCFI